MSCYVTPGWSLSHALSCYETDTGRESYVNGCEALVMSFEDAEFCAHARTDVPDLVARVREVEEENTRLKDDLEHAKSFAWTADGELIRVTRVSDAPDGWVVDVEDQTVAVGLDRDAALARARQKEEK